MISCLIQSSSSPPAPTDPGSESCSGMGVSHCPGPASTPSLLLLAPPEWSGGRLRGQGQRVAGALQTCRGGPCVQRLSPAHMPVGSTWACSAPATLPCKAPKAQALAGCSLGQGLPPVLRPGPFQQHPLWKHGHDVTGPTTVKVNSGPAESGTVSGSSAPGNTGHTLLSGWLELTVVGGTFPGGREKPSIIS